MRDNGKWGEGNRVKRYTHKFANFQRKHGERGGGRNRGALTERRNGREEEVYGSVNIMRDNKVYIGQNRGILHYDLDNRLLVGVHGYRALIMLIACIRCRRIN